MCMTATATGAVARALATPCMSPRPHVYTVHMCFHGNSDDDFPTASSEQVRMVTWHEPPWTTNTASTAAGDSHRGLTHALLSLDDEVHIVRSASALGGAPHGVRLSRKPVALSRHVVVSAIATHSGCLVDGSPDNQAFIADQQGIIVVYVQSLTVLRVSGRPFTYVCCGTAQCES